jgi:hypothetical protein
MAFAGEVIVGDWESAKLYSLDFSTDTPTTEIRCRRFAWRRAFNSQSGNWVFFNELSLTSSLVWAQMRQAQGFDPDLDARLVE